MNYYLKIKKVDISLIYNVLIQLNKEKDYLFSREVGKGY